MYQCVIYNVWIRGLFNKLRGACDFILYGMPDQIIHLPPTPCLLFTMAYLPLFQNRAKRPGNKRPPSRQKLREAGSTSSPTNSDSSISPNLFVRTAQEPAKPISRLEHAITEETGIFRTKKTTVTNSAQKNSKPRKDDSNLFSSNVPSSLKGPGLKSQSQPTPSTSVFDSPPKDIFAPPPGKLTGIGESGDLFSSHQNEVKSASKKLDGILSSPSSSSKNADKSKLGRVDETDRGNKVRWDVHSVVTLAVLYT